MENENIDESKTVTNDFIDKVTLELLMNKNHYNRYVSQNDPKKHKEYMDHLSKVKKYSNMIINTTTEFLENPNNQVTTEVNDAFDVYVRTLIRHFECKNLENMDEKDQDMLFGFIREPVEEEEQQPSKSFWGKHRVQKKSSTFGFPMNYIPRVQENKKQEPLDYIV